MHLPWTRSNAKRRLATFASGFLRHLLKIGQPIKSSFVNVKLSNRSRSLRPLKPFASWPWRQILVASRPFQLLRVQCKRSYRWNIIGNAKSAVSSTLLACQAQKDLQAISPRIFDCLKTFQKAILIASHCSRILQIGNIKEAWWPLYFCQLLCLKYWEWCKIRRSLSFSIIKIGLIFLFTVGSLINYSESETWQQKCEGEFFDFKSEFPKTVKDKSYMSLVRTDFQFVRLQ